MTTKVCLLHEKTRTRHRLNPRRRQIPGRGTDHARHATLLKSKRIARISSHWMQCRPRKDSQNLYQCRSNARGVAPALAKFWSCRMISGARDCALGVNINLHQMAVRVTLVWCCHIQTWPHQSTVSCRPLSSPPRMHTWRNKRLRYFCPSWIHRHVSSRWLRCFP